MRTFKNIVAGLLIVVGVVYIGSVKGDLQFGFGILMITTGIFNLGKN